MVNAFMSGFQVGRDSRNVMPLQYLILSWPEKASFQVGYTVAWMFWQWK